MNEKDFIICVILVTLAVQVKSQGRAFMCSIVSKDGLVDFKNLDRTATGFWKVTLPSQEVFEFNICVAMPACNDNKTYTWAQLRNTTGDCEGPLTNSSTPAYNLITSNEGKIEGIKIDYAQSLLPCENGSYHIETVIKCNRKINQTIAQPVVDVAGKCNYKVVIEVENGCPYLDLNNLAKFVNTHAPLFCLALVIFGVIVGAAGLRMWSSIVFALVAFACIAALVFVTYEFLLPVNAPLWELWLIFILSTVFGLIIAYISAKYDYIGFALIGGWIGVSGAVFLINIYVRLGVAAVVMYTAWRKNEPLKGALISAAFILIPMIYIYFINEFTMLFTMVFFAVVTAHIAYKIKDLLIIISTSFLGSYIIVRGISIIVKGFPDELALIEKIKKGGFKMETVESVYLILLVLLTIVFIFLQEYMKGPEQVVPEKKDEELEDYKSMSEESDP